ncbi:helix-turn-helix domain-containing protein [Microcella humidisoli]|jgi:DNA-binding transcriptional ArsR family regulator|uniref:Helix-turn-helix domain-containing protein n=1 Tax=Microcella humidisoli TaxID=2963406 RepID=A0ABY5FWK3_9MICO|nr:helix-turn-helix domain-containing protein [Microcella humidisoli]UTT62151.1 helix-turn-helix domain-containing protein [Microcella humidisoli]
MTSAELLLHPVRLRVVQAMMGRTELTTKDLAARLPDVAPATLYRHVGTLVDGGVLEVVSERRVRGSTERSLRLREERASVDPEALAHDDDALRAGFLAYLASLAAMLDDYLAAPHGSLQDDLVSFRQLAVQATDEEWLAVLHGIRAAIEPLATRADAPEGARRRVLATVSLPVD